MIVFESECKDNHFLVNTTLYFHQISVILSISLCRLFLFY